MDFWSKNELLRKCRWHMIYWIFLFVYMLQEYVHILFSLHVHSTLFLLPILTTGHVRVQFRWGENDECLLYHQCCQETWMFNIFASWRHHRGMSYGANAYPRFPNQYIESKLSEPMYSRHGSKDDPTKVSYMWGQTICSLRLLKTPIFFSVYLNKSSIYWLWESYFWKYLRPSILYTE